MNNYTIFISDLHLSLATTKTANLFFRFTQEIAPKANAIYILGDLFKFWAGDDDRSEFNERIKLALRTISSITPTYLMPGNRDFILGRDFAKESGCILIPDPFKIDLYNIPILLTHGDILCTKDAQHRMFRSITRLPCGIAFFLKLPLKFRIWLASNIQKFSAKHKLSKDKKTLLPQKDAIERLLLKYNAKKIIHGHIHKIEEETNRISLDEWKDSISVLIYYEDGKYEFKNFT